MKAICILFSCLLDVFRAWHLTQKGQLPKYEILQLAHRLEKGLLNNDPKPFWGWEKAKRLASLLNNCNDSFAKETGSAVLSSYLLVKSHCTNSEEKEMATELINKYNFNINKCHKGGVVNIDKESIMFNGDEQRIISQLFLTRHSTRVFSERRVLKTDLLSAIKLAIQSPSACNRQTTHLYIYQSENIQSIILTGNIRAFSVGEFHDWIVSTSIFAAYLSLSLHLFGIGSCIWRKQLYGKHPYNEKTRSLCKIPKEEKIILEIRFGYYMEKNTFPVSNRNNADKICTFIN